MSEVDYEGEMAKATLKKLIVFSQEILPYIEDSQQLPAWLQDKFSKLDYYIDSVYSYIKFNELTKPQTPNPEMSLEVRIDEP